VIVVIPSVASVCAPVPLVGCAVSALTGGIGGALGSGVTGAAGDVAKGIMGVFVGYLASGASWLVGQIIALAGPKADPTLDARWFSQHAGAMRALLEGAVAPLLLAATIGAVLRQDMKRLARAWGIGLPLALVAGIAAVAFAKFALSLTDAMTSQITGQHGLDAAPAFGHLISGGLESASPPLVAGAIYLFAFVGAIFVWLELVVRESAIYIAMFFMPLALATYVWPATAAVAKRAVQLVVALILSKFVIFATIVLGLDAFSHAATLDQEVAATGILLLATFAPFALLKLAPIVEVAAIAHLEGMSRRPFRAASRVAATAVAPGHPVVRGLLATRASNGPPSGPSSVMAQPLAARQPDYPLGDSRSTDG